MTVQTALSDSMGLIGVFEREEMLLDAAANL